MPLSEVSPGSEVTLRESPLRTEGGVDAVVGLPTTFAPASQCPHHPLHSASCPQRLTCGPCLPAPCLLALVKPAMTPGRRPEEGERLKSQSLSSSFLPVRLLWIVCLLRPKLTTPLRRACSVCLLSGSLNFYLPLESKDAKFYQRQM